MLSFVRHFGRIFRRQRVTGLRNALPEIHAQGGELVVVGCGMPEHIAGFRAVTGYDGPLVNYPRGP